MVQERNPLRELCPAVIARQHEAEGVIKLLKWS